MPINPYEPPKAAIPGRAFDWRSFVAVVVIILVLYLNLYFAMQAAQNAEEWATMGESIRDRKGFGQLVLGMCMIPWLVFSACVIRWVTIHVRRHDQRLHP